MGYFTLKREWVPFEGSITTHLGLVLPKSYHSLFRRKVPPHSTQWIINLDKSKWNVEVTKNGFLKNILSGVWRSFRLQNHKSGLWRFLNIFLNSGPLCATHWARIQKKVQKPPHSTHQIPGFFLSKNPERVDCGGIFNSKFFKSDQKSTEIQWKSSHPPKRGWSDYEKTNPRWVGMLPSKGIHPLFRGSHLT